MKDGGLGRAIDVAGGMRALARAIGVTQPAISNWKRVPASRVAQVERATGVPRDVLRPDLYAHERADAPMPPMIDEVDEARALEYELVGTLLWRAPGSELLASLAALRGDGTALGMAHLALAEAAQATSVSEVQTQFFELFVGLGRGEFLPYASYYLTGFLQDRPLALLRADMDRLGLARADRVNEPEDHIAVLFDVMSRLIRREVAAEGLGEAEFFARHIQPWAARFFAELEVSRISDFYRRLGRIGSLLVEIEQEAFRLPAESGSE